MLIVGFQACTQATSTPNSTKEVAVDVESPHVSLIEHHSSSPILISVESIEELERSFLEKFNLKCAQRAKCSAQSPNTCPHQQPCSSATCPPISASKEHGSLQESKPSNDSLTLRICSEKCPKTTKTKTSGHNDVTCPFASLLQDLTNSCQEPLPPKSKSTVEPPTVPCLTDPEASPCSISPCSTPREPKFPCDSTFVIPGSSKSHRDSSQTKTNPCDVNPGPADLASCQEDTCLHLKGSCPPVIPSPGPPFRPCLVTRVPCAQSTPCSPQETAKEESFVASTLKDIVLKITSLASSAIEYISDDGSGSPCDKDRTRAGRRSVQFNPCADCRDIEELYFNEGLKKSAASFECEPCSNEEANKDSISPCLQIKDEECPARDHAEESGAGSSVAGSGSGSGEVPVIPVCDAARADYYHKKLMATLQVLQNKEDTVRVQAASLALAEQRIDTLSAELDRKDLEVRTLRKASCPSQQKREACTETIVASTEVESQKKMVKTLQSNLSVIEDLYRECFYETAKQDELIEKLRKSYLDVRLMEKEKADHIGRLQNVVNSHRWSLERCQSVSVEVENLKMEISNFLNSSNNDSGMWEESLAVEVNEDLQDIMQQLLQLKQVLQKDCTCDLQEENKSLKEQNKLLERQMQELRERTVDLESALVDRDETIKRYKKKVDETNDQMECLRQELLAIRKRDENRCHNEECLKNQLRKAQETLKEKNTELEEIQRHCTEQDVTISELQVNMERAEQLNKENQSIRSEIQYLSAQVASWRRALSQAECRARCLEKELMRARTHTRHVDTCYREKASAVSALREQLETAHARGAALCGEARQAVAAVRRWLAHMKETNAEQKEKIKEQESTIVSLTQMLQEKVPCSTLKVSRDSGASKPPMEESSCDVDYTKHKKRASSTSPTIYDSDQDLSNRPQTSTCSAKEPTICRCSRVAAALRTRVREMDDVDTPIAPPRREVRRRACQRPVNIMRFGEGGGGAARDASAQSPTRAHRAVGDDRSALLTQVVRTSSPAEELCSRVERLSDALADGQRRWSRDRLRRT